MKRTRYSEEQIIKILKEAEAGRSDAFLTVGAPGRRAFVPPVGRVGGKIEGGVELDVHLGRCRTAGEQHREQSG